MVKRLTALILLAALASLAVAACSSATAAEPTPQPPSPPPPPPAPTVLVDTSAGAGATGTSAAEGTEFVVALEDIGGSGQYAFAPADLTFTVGDAITFVLTAQTEFHTFTVDDLGLDVVVNGGETVRHTFTFDQAGTFSLICIPHGLQGMVGTITVN